MLSCGCFWAFARLPGSALSRHVFVCAHSRRGKRRTLLAPLPQGAPEATPRAFFPRDPAGSDAPPPGWAGPAGACAHPHQCRSGNRRARARKDLPAENIVAEPAKRDTAAAIALGVAWVSLRDARATMWCCRPITHQGYRGISNDAAHRRGRGGADRRTGDHRHRAHLGLPGLRLHRGRSARRDPPTCRAQPAVHEVMSFREKPNAELAERFLRQGTFRWNAGMFIWSIPAILSAFNRHAPALAKFIEQYHSSRQIASAGPRGFPGAAEDLDRLCHHGKGGAGADGGGRL